DGHVRVLAIDGANAFGWDDLRLPARTALFSPDGKTLALAVGVGGTWLYAVPEHRWTYTQDHQSPVIVSLFSPHGRWFVSGDMRGTVTLRDRAATDALQHGSSAEGQALSVQPTVQPSEPDGH